MSSLGTTDASHGLVLTEAGCELFTIETLGLDSEGLPENLAAVAQFVLLTEDEARVCVSGTATISASIDGVVETALPLREGGFLFRAPSLKTMKVSTSRFDEIFNN